MAIMQCTSFDTFSSKRSEKGRMSTTIEQIFIRTRTKFDSSPVYSIVVLGYHVHISTVSHTMNVDELKVV